MWNSADKNQNSHSRKTVSSVDRVKSFFIIAVNIFFYGEHSTHWGRGAFISRFFTLVASREISGVRPQVRKNVSGFVLSISQFLATARLCENLKIFSASLHSLLSWQFMMYFMKMFFSF